VRSYSPAQIERWRNRVHRRLGSQRISNRRNAVSFVNEVGFCFVFEAGEMVLPSLGGAIEVGSTREILPDEHDALMGRILLHRPTLVSMKFIPYFMALHTSTREGLNRPSGSRPPAPVAHLILESLRKKSPQSTRELRERVMRGTGIGKGSFDFTLRQLQASISVSSIIERNGLPSGSWTLVRRVYGNQIRKARAISHEEARRAILEQHFRNQLVLTVAEIRHLFRWSRQEIFQTLGELIRRGIVTPEVQVDGIADRTYCLLT
jgi:hypothetical protein